MAKLYEQLVDVLNFTYGYTMNEKGLMIYCKHCKAFHPADFIARVAHTRASYYSSDFSLFYEHKDFNELAMEHEKLPGGRRDINAPATGKNDSILKRYPIDKTAKPVYVTHDRAKRISERDYKARANYDSNNNPYYTRLIVEEYVCPKCHARYHRDTVLHCDMTTRDRKYESICYGASVYEEDNAKGQKLLKACFCFMDYSTFGGRVQITKSRIKLVSNVHTGQTYVIGKKYLSGTKRTYKTSNKLFNISLKMNEGLLTGNFYSSKQVFEAMQIMYKRIYEEKTLLMGHKPDAFKEDIIATPYLIARLNRHPNASRKVIDKNNVARTCFSFKYTYVKKNILRGYKHTDGDFVTYVLKAGGIQPTKKFKKYIRENHASVHLLRAYHARFDDINNIYKLIDARMDDILRTDREDFVKDLIVYCGENNAVNKIIADRNAYHLSDTVYQYNALKEFANNPRELEEDEEPVEIDLSLDGTIKEIHDRFSKQYFKIKDRNIKLKYTDEQKELQIHDHEKYLLRFAKDTHELIDVGRTMNICVGSYGKRADNGNCHIVLVIEKATERLVGCIELNSEMTSVKQAKGFANYRIEDGAYEFVVDWMNENNLVNGNYYDILKEGYEESLRKTHAQEMADREERKKVRRRDVQPAPVLQGIAGQIEQGVVEPNNNRVDDEFGLAF